MTTSGGRTRNRRGEGGLLRDEIVAAAERILEREGDEAAITLRSVAREAGIAAPSIYAHFADRDAVIEAVLDIAFDRLRQIVIDTTTALADDDCVASLLAGCHAYVDFAMREPARYRVLFGRLREGRPDLKMPLKLEDVPPKWRSRLQSFEVLVHALAACVAAGRSTSTDPFADAALVWTALHGAVMMRQFVPGFPWPPFEESVDAVVLRICRISQ
ncbi:TetR/AcrR family transcriptional regulator [Dactylosporangium sp. NPDC049742]|uniref:TetR/AcrR family transcriptional regulator n=1 Tax=Dactylosporangium sp. NPDC049742 TaxID=3154737 RepID=UPI00341CD4FC